jgi:site-specific recombinase XerD
MVAVSPKRLEALDERYDQCLQIMNARRGGPPDQPQPLPSRDWPQENVALLLRYGKWLEGGGASLYVIRSSYIPIAGIVLGLAGKPYDRLDLQADLPPALDFVIAMGIGAAREKVQRYALAKFRRFLLHQRGQVEVKIRPYDPLPHTTGLPAWLVEEITHYQHLCQRNWREARLEENIRRFWSGHLRIWRFLCEQCGIRELGDIRRKHLHAYVDARLEAKASVSTINGDLRSLVGLLRFLQEQGYAVPQALFTLHNLKQPERLPKFLTDDQVRALRDDVESRLAQARFFAQRRDALLDRATFYLLWQCGLRRGEVEELRLEDLDLEGRKLSVRNGKGLKDRTVFLTGMVIQALRDYLPLRGEGPTDHVFLYRNQPLSKDLIHGRLKATGQHIGVKVYAHRLRHTCATQLLNAGCPVTSIQKLLGHKKLNTTMVYARAHDQTVEADYFAAMGRIEQCMALVGQPAVTPQAVDEGERGQLRSLAEQLFVPEMTLERRLEIAAQICGLLGTASPEEWIPPPKPVLANVEAN